MANEFILQMQPWFGEEEKRAVCEYMDEGGFITEFKRTQLFERMIAEYTGAKHCIVVNNGTISLTLAAIAAGIQPGDEVLVPNFTMIATPNSIKMIGAVPVFVDVEAETLCLDVAAARRALSARTRAIMLVAANGRYPKAGIASFEKFAAETGIVLIEDAAQAMGSRYPDGRHIGRAGLVGSFSFSSPKIVSTGQGGALITDSDELAFQLRLLKDFGRTGGGNDIHDYLGFNFKFTELQACVGIEQMKKLPRRVQRKKEIFRQYQERLHDTVGVKLFEHDLANTTPWFIDSVVERRAELQNYLKDHGIGTRVMYPPINQQKVYRPDSGTEKELDFPVSNRIGQAGLWLPSANQLSDADVDRICRSIREFYK